MPKQSAVARRGGAVEAVQVFLEERGAGAVVGAYIDVGDSLEARPRWMVIDHRDERRQREPGPEVRGLGVDHDRLVEGGGVEREMIAQADVEHAHHRLVVEAGDRADARDRDLAHSFAQEMGHGEGARECVGVGAQHHEHPVGGGEESGETGGVGAQALGSRSGQFAPPASAVPGDFRFTM